MSIPSFANRRTYRAADGADRMNSRNLGRLAFASDVLAMTIDVRRFFHGLALDAAVFARRG
jgi:hypothetical protein